MSAAYDLDELSGITPHTTRARCMNPECQESCTFDPDTGGQKPLFCSAKCRVAFGTQRRKLLDELAQVGQLLADSSVSKAKRRQIVKLQTHLRWLLERYPSDRASID
ncbi:hypothetical protein K8O93_05605 [Gordonia bronchialis]|uniref:hypothetical protein n=1 Tax=Gordonia bronchialis TaxID=2054 RepID=UPI001CBE0D86|nr:hypothetical protein [Gordonia bronchialis]UAK39190.1 hypothetical protein K8O93_05605 [Gordonia bronchialis]